jgi:hypothetical protein
MPVPPVPSFVSPPSNIVGSTNQIGTITITDAAGNLVKVGRAVINSASGDVVVGVDSAGNLTVGLSQEISTYSELVHIRRLLVEVVAQLRMTNSLMAFMFGQENIEAGIISDLENDESSFTSEIEDAAEETVP